MSDMESAFKEIRKIAHELVDAEELPAWERSEQVTINKAREKALECMRLIGRRQLGKIGKEDDWGT